MPQAITHFLIPVILLELYRDGRLCLNDDESEQQEPQLICSLGIIEDGE